MGGKAAIIIVIGFGFAIGYVSLNLNRIATTSVANTSTYFDMSSSHTLAVTGTYVALAKVYETPSWVGQITQDLRDDFHKGSFVARLDTIGPDKARLRTVSTYPMSAGKTLHDTIDVYFNRIKRNSFSMYAWMTNTELMGSTPIYWITRDTVWGRVHSNGTLYVDGQPVFMEKATTSRGFNPDVGTGTNHAIFKNGYETGIASIKFPDDFNELTTAASSGGRAYTGETWLSCTAGTAADNDGMVYVRHSSGGPIVDSINLSNASFNGVISCNTKIHVQGTVDGRLSICSQSDVIVENDVLCANSPNGNPSSNDMIGLIADHDVVVADNTANNNNCVIEASIFCRTGGFRAENYNSRGEAGTLSLVGSIVQNARGPVAQFSGSKITDGFSKRYRYDNRLGDPSVRPPWYPGFYAKTLSISNWWESYRIMEFM